MSKTPVAQPLILRLPKSTYRSQNLGQDRLDFVKEALQ